MSARVIRHDVNLVGGAAGYIRMDDPARDPKPAPITDPKRKDLAEAYPHERFDSQSEAYIAERHRLLMVDRDQERKDTQAEVDERVAKAAHAEMVKRNVNAWKREDAK